MPDSTEPYLLEFYYIERIADAGSAGSDNPEVPSRFLPCLVSGLAYHIALKKPELQDRIGLLKQLYDEQWQQAVDADRGKESLFFVPGGYRY